MRFIMVDDERLSLSYLRTVCEEVGITDAEYFLDPHTALDFAAKNPAIDVAFLDIEMPDMTGIDLAVRLREINSAMKIVFVTGHDSYARQAFAIHANGFVSKPFDAREIAAEIKNLSGSIAELPQKRVRIKTFGNFEVFADGKRVLFSSNKAKELLAYLVDRGGSSVTNEQAIAILWEDAANDVTSQNRFRKTVRSLKLTLEAYRVNDLFNNGRNNKSVNTVAFSCDYYEYLEGRPEAQDSFMGEYMTGYDWAEDTLGVLVHKHGLYV